jgi:hypothetical protein
MLLSTSVGAVIALGEELSAEHAANPASAAMATNDRA